MGMNLPSNSNDLPKNLVSFLSQVVFISGRGVDEFSITN
jgi:hypothetical protein